MSYYTENTFSVRYFRDGGKRQQRVKEIAAELGVKVRFFPSPYIGHYGVEALTPTGKPLRNKRLQSRLERRVYGL